MFVVFVWSCQRLSGTIELFLVVESTQAIQALFFFRLYFAGSFIQASLILRLLVLWFRRRVLTSSHWFNWLHRRIPSANWQFSVGVRMAVGLFRFAPFLLYHAVYIVARRGFETRVGFYFDLFAFWLYLYGYAIMLCIDGRVFCCCCVLARTNCKTRLLLKILIFEC